MFAGFFQMPPPAEPPKPEPQSSPTSLDEMMEKGREMQMQYLASLQSIFSGTDKAGGDKT
jgi:hypothetical protein